MDERDRIDHLSKEYMRLQQVVEDFDSKALTIKAWSVTLSAAGIVTAFSQSKATILLIAAGSSIVFWLVEALWKQNQQAYYPRIKEIERAFTSGDFSVAPYQIASSWSQAWTLGRRSRMTIFILCWPHVFLPHIVVAIAALVLFLLYAPVPPAS
jgi:hypothetical protein